MKKLCDYFIKNRFIISIILTLVFSVIGFFVNLTSFSFYNWIINTDHVFSLWSNFKFFGLLLCSYELFLIITSEDKYLSIVSSLIIVFSSAVAYNFTKIDSMFLGCLIVVLFNKLLANNSKKNTILLAISIFVVSIIYSYTFIPYAVAFGYVFIALILYLLLKNKYLIKNDKFKKRVLIITFIFSILGIVVSKLVIKNEYTDNVVFKINGFDSMFYYLFGMNLPFSELQNKDLLSSIIGLCPLPILISLFYIYKNEKHIEFLLPITTIGVFEIVFCMSSFPEVINKILLLNNIGTTRIMSSIQFANFLIILYFISTIKEKLFSVKVAMRITVAFIVLLIFITFPTVFSTRGYLTLFVIEITMLSFLFLNVEERKYRKVFMFFLLLFTLIGGIPVYLL